MLGQQSPLGLGVASPGARAARDVDVGEGQDRARAPDRAGEQEERVLTGVEADRNLLGLEDEPLGISAGVLQAVDRQPAEALERDPGGRDLREVVAEQGQLDRGRDLLVVATRFGGAGRGESEDGVRAVLRGASRERDGLPCGGSAGAGDHRHPPADRLAHRPQEAGALLGLERHRLPGGARHHHGLHALLDELPGVSGGLLGAQLAVLAEDGDQSDADAAEHGARALHRPAG